MFEILMALTLMGSLVAAAGGNERSIHTCIRLYGAAIRDLRSAYDEITDALQTSVTLQCGVSSLMAKCMGYGVQVFHNHEMLSWEFFFMIQLLEFFAKC